MAEIGNNRVGVFDKDGNSITHRSKRGSAKGKFGNLNGIVVDKELGWVSVANTADNRIQVFKPVR